MILKYKLYVIISLIFAIVLFYNGSDKYCNEAIIGEGINNLKLGDNIEKVKKELGNPEYIWVNKAWDNGRKYTDIGDFVNKYIDNDLFDTFENHLEYYRLFGYYGNDGKTALYDQPVFKECWVYYSKGLCIYLDNKDNILQFILITGELKFMKKTKYEFTPFVGVVKELDIKTDELYQNVRNNFLKFSKYSLYFDDESEYGSSNLTVSIFGKNTYFVFSPRTNKLLYISIIDKSIGGVHAIELLDM